MTSFGVAGSISSCRIKGTWHTLTDSPMAGTVTITPNPKILLDAVDNITYPQVPYVATLDSSGSIDLYVIATDDPDTNPWNFTYLVTESITYADVAYTNTYSIKAPSGQVVQLASVTPVAGNVGTPILRGPQGPAGANGTSVGLGKTIVTSLIFGG